MAIVGGGSGERRGKRDEGGKGRAGSGAGDGQSSSDTKAQP